MKIADKINRVILQYQNMILKLHVKLKNDNGTFTNVFKFKDNEYIKLSIYGFITLELPKDKETNEYDPSRSFFIGPGNIGTVVTRMKRLLNNIYKHEIFAIKNNIIISYEDMVKKYTEKVQIVNLSQALLLKPAVIYDENETSYEGVNIYVNNTSNIISLSIDEYENMVYVLEKIDIFTASQLLVNYYLTYLTNKTELDKLLVNQTDFNRPQIDWGTSENKTISNYSNDEEPDIFEGIN